MGVDCRWAPRSRGAEARKGAPGADRWPASRVRGIAGGRREPAAAGRGRRWAPSVLGVAELDGGVVWRWTALAERGRVGGRGRPGNARRGGGSWGSPQGRRAAGVGGQGGGGGGATIASGSGRPGSWRSPGRTASTTTGGTPAPAGKGTRRLGEDGGEERPGGIGGGAGLVRVGTGRPGECARREACSSSTRPRRTWSARPSRSLAADLLRRHVSRRAHEGPGAGERGVHRAAVVREGGAGPPTGGAPAVERGRRGDAEVEHLHQPVVSHQDVLGLDVAVHDPGPVRGGEGAGQRRRASGRGWARGRTRPRRTGASTSRGRAPSR